MATILIIENTPQFASYLTAIPGFQYREIATISTADFRTQGFTSIKPDLILADNNQIDDSLWTQIVGASRAMLPHPPIGLFNIPADFHPDIFPEASLYLSYELPAHVMLSMITYALQYQNLNAEFLELRDIQYRLRQEVVINQTMYEAAKLINSSLTLDRVLDEVLGLLSGLMKFHCLAIMLTDKNTKELIIQAALPYRILVGKGLPWTGDILSPDNNDLRPEILPHRNIFHMFRTIPPLIYDDFLTIPMITDSELIGFIVVSDSKNNLRLDREDISLILDMAPQVANAIRNARLFARVEELAVQDGLTKLYNRNYFQTVLREEIGRAKKFQYHLSLLMIDIDFFKGINDTYGHQIGDEVLKKVCDILRTSVRKSDTVSRYGGEEMTVMLVGADRENGLIIGEKLRTRIEELTLYAVELPSDTGEIPHMLIQQDTRGDLKCLLYPGSESQNPDEEDDAEFQRLSNEERWLKVVDSHLKNKPIGKNAKYKDVKISNVKVTASIGVASFPDDFTRNTSATSALLDATSDDDLLLYMSDKALYKAKRNGRNRTLTYYGVQQVFRVGTPWEIEIEAVKTVLEMLHNKDRETWMHCLRVSRMSEIIANEMNLKGPEVQLIKLGGALHDIGKILIDDAILFKNSHLSDEEFEIIKAHPLFGAEFIQDYPVLQKYANAIKHHHERWEGSGYPEGISGLRIPLEARIIAVADSYDAMTFERRYSKGVDNQEDFAMNELKTNLHIIYDPDVMQAFFNRYQQIKTIKTLPIETLSLK